MDRRKQVFANSTPVMGQTPPKTGNTLFAILEMILATKTTTPTINTIIPNVRITLFFPPFSYNFRSQRTLN
jgi:hypothetical protein